MLDCLILKSPLVGGFFFMTFYFCYNLLRSFMKYITFVNNGRLILYFFYMFFSSFCVDCLHFVSFFCFKIMCFVKITLIFNFKRLFLFYSVFILVLIFRLLYLKLWGNFAYIKFNNHYKNKTSFTYYLK